MDKYLEVVEAALEAGVRPRCHLEDVTRADIKGFVIPFVQRLEWHGHNDFHKVHINGATAWLYGANALNTTLFGFGERTGTPPLEGALIEYISLKGDLSGIDLSVITEIAEYFLKDIGADIPSNYPFAGRDFNTTRAGIHAGGLRRNEEIYNIFDTTGLLGRPPKVAITDKSGTDGVAIWVNDFLGLKGKERLTLMKVAKVQRWVLDQYEKEGRLTAISDKELEEQVKIYFPDLYKRVKNK